MNDYNDKICWVTGASSGIGEALSHELASRGAKLILSSRNQQALDKLRARLPNPDRHEVLAFDLCDTESHQSIAQQAWELNQRIDLLVNNGGVSQRSLAIDTELKVDRMVMEVDYFGTISLTKSLLPLLIRQDSSTIVNIASVAGKIGSSMRSAYSGAKHALIGFMDCLRAEVAADGVKVVNVCPGWVQTNISKNALTGDMSTYNQIDKEIAQGMPVEQFVRRLLKQLKSNKLEIIVADGLPRLGYQLRRFFPNYYHRLLPKIYQRKQ